MEMPKRVYSYPDDERLEVLVLANSPCTPKEILTLEKMPVKPNTLETIRKRLDWLCNQGKLKKKKIAHANVYWHSSIDDYKKRTILKRTERLVTTEEDHLVKA
jgi:hypothetical protein